MVDVKKIAGMTLCRYQEPYTRSNPLLLRAGNLGTILMARANETNLHAHPDADTVWLVLKGRVKFYGFDDEFVGELGPLDGLAIPKGVPYWFESADGEEYLIYHITAKDFSVKDTHRINYKERIQREPAAGAGARAPGVWTNKTERIATEDDRKTVQQMIETLNAAR